MVHKGVVDAAEQGVLYRRCPVGANDDQFRVHLACNIEDRLPDVGVVGFLAHTDIQAVLSRQSAALVGHFLSAVKRESLELSVGGGRSFVLGAERVGEKFAGGFQTCSRTASLQSSVWCATETECAAVGEPYNRSEWTSTPNSVSGLSTSCHRTPVAPGPIVTACASTVRIAAESLLNARHSSTHTLTSSWRHRTT
jgi:hypothetical protein